MYCVLLLSPPLQPFDFDPEILKRLKYFATNLLYFHYQMEIRDLPIFHALMSGFGTLLVAAFEYYVNKCRENLQIDILGFGQNGF